MAATQRPAGAPSFEPSLEWLIFPPVIQSLFVIPLQPLWPRSREVTNVSPWKQTCHLCPIRWNPALPERNQLVTWLIPHQYNTGTFDSQVAITRALFVIVRVTISLFVSQAFLSFLSSFISISIPPMACRPQSLGTSQFDDTGQLKDNTSRWELLSPIDRSGRKYALFTGLEKLQTFTKNWEKWNKVMTHN